jgi:hypothetical protein
VGLSKIKAGSGRFILIRAAVGGGVLALVQLTLMGFQGRVAFIPLVIFVGLGAVTGAVYGTAVELLGEAGRIVGFIVSVIPLCFVIVLELSWYAIAPWSAPHPYPGSEIEMTGSTGAWGHFRNQTYTITLSMSEAQQYYQKQMDRYCVDDWKFIILSECEGYSQCREARCEIRRFLLEQYFTVNLYSVSDRETLVSQWDAWQD